MARISRLTADLALLKQFAIPALQLKVDLCTELGLKLSAFKAVEVWCAQLGFSVTLVEAIAADYFVV